ncbi:acyl-CoA dehydrogenase family protein [Chachezhania sediminis]|uniref:acyl-CoA dehydrogenase family protein n=1 Tax=Chachezhania sediminis TaxID=2599291 RepID=UPI00131A88EE|nr:acyl-CoA dehydrogenase family protein [Chachezhania sediminis]
MTFLEHLTPSDETRMICEAAEKWTAGISDADVRASKGFSASRWGEMAEMGWHGLLVDPDHGGLGLDPAALSLLCQAIGRARLPEPFVSSSVVCVGTLSSLGQDVSALVDGSAIAAPAGFGLPCDGVSSGITATPAADGHHLSGTVDLCEAGPDTTEFLVVTAGGDALYRLPHMTPGLTVTPYGAIDGRPLARLAFDCHLPAEARLATGDAARAAIRRGNALAVSALAADATGTIEKAIGLTTAYIDERSQFGRPLAAFQALRHMVADLLVELEAARSMTELAAFAASDDGDPKQLHDRVRARICRAAQSVGHAAIQLHGGMGMTDEMAIGHYFRRLIFLQAMMGQEAGALRDRAATLAEEIELQREVAQ